MTDRTLVLCKPDAVERGLVGEIVGRLERKGLTIVALELRTARRRPRRPPLRRARGQAVLRRPRRVHHPRPARGDGGRRARDTWQVVRTLMGATNPREAAPGTIRGDLAIEITENLVHGSDGPSRPTREIALFFPDSVAAEPSSGVDPRARRCATVAVAAELTVASHEHAPPTRRSRSRVRALVLLASSAATWPSTSAPPTRSSTCAATASCSTSRRSSRSTRSDGRPLAVGIEAKRMIGRTPGHIQADPAAEGRRHRRLRHLREDAPLLHPEGAPAPVGEAADGHLRPVGHHRRRAARRAGRRRVRRRPQAGATSSRSRWPPRSAPGLPVHEPAGNMIVDIGGGTTEVAVISLGGIVVERVGPRRRRRARRGDHPVREEGVLARARRAHRRGDQDRSSGSAWPLEEELHAEIRGRDLVTGLPKTIVVSTERDPRGDRGAGRRRSSTR